MNTYTVQIHTTVGAFVTAPLTKEGLQSLVKDINAARSVGDRGFPESLVVFTARDGGIVNLTPAVFQCCGWVIINNPTPRTGSPPAEYSVLGAA